MAEISRVDLFGKLNSLGYKSVESATVFCKLRGNPYVEFVHFLHQIFQLQDSDVHRIVAHFNMDASHLAADMTANLDSLPRGATSISDFSPHLEDSIERAWVFSTLLYKESSVRTGHIVVGMMKSPALKNVLPSISSEFSKIKPDELSDNFRDIVNGSSEEHLAAQDGSHVGGGALPGEASGATPAEMGQQEALGQFCVDLTEQAAGKTMDPIIGRDEEIRQIMDILMRRRQNNPILTGEAGVGKTAVVEGFAQRIVAGDVPPPLQGVRLLSLDMGLLQAGASMKGEFENRLRQVIEEVQSSPKPIIMFIDEAHTLIGAGGAAGQNDAANLLKPALARGTLRTIAATTWAEYKKFFEKDPALTRRFQVVKIEEPDVEKAIVMMRALASVSEKHHRVQILDDGLRAAVELSSRYIPARQLPDKSVSLLDTACARVAISQHATPAAVEDAQRRIMFLNTEMEILDREESTGSDHAKRKGEIEEHLAEEQQDLDKLEAEWKAEKELVDQILELRGKLRGIADGVIEEAAEAAAEAAADAAAEAGADDAAVAGAAAGAAAGAEAATNTEADAVERESWLNELKGLQAKLDELQGEHPLILPSVDYNAIASVVGDWTGIPVGRMVKNEIESVMNLADTLETRVIGQRHGLEAIAERIKISRAGMENPSRPIAVFLLAGTSGVGKTETALSLAEALYGGEQNLITINMSEFQEAHTVSTLKGAPPGYVGYGEGGVLTEAVRRRPYSVVLLDEVEKAHPDVHEIFFQVFDKGVMEDGEGRMIDFKNTIILLTSNAGSDLIMNMCKDPELMPEPAGIAKALREPLLQVFPAALLGRLSVIPYYPLSDEMIDLIARLQMKKVARRLKASHDIPFTYDEEVITQIAARCTELESGARAIEAIVVQNLLPAISGEILKRIISGQELVKVHASVEDNDFSFSFE